MPYVPPKYPGAIPTAEDLPNRADDVDWMYAARYNELKKELRAALIELGTDPAGASADVKTRLGLLAPKASPVFTGQATIPTINLTGGQIAFPAAVAPNADPNTLDDYEEGSFAPTIAFGGASVGATYNIQVGKYTKIGDAVLFSLALRLTSKGESIGSATLEGLPFTSNSTADYRAPCIIIPVVSLTFADVPFVWMGNNVTKILLYEVTKLAVLSTLTDANFANDTVIYISGQYKI